MRTRILVCAGAIALGMGLALAAPLSAQTQSEEQRRVYGYQDPFTGTFHPIEEVVPDPATTPSFNGTFVFTFNVLLKTTLEKASPTVTCSVTVVAISIASGTGGASEVSYSETGSSIANVTGNSANCVVTMHYNWVMPQTGTSASGSVVDTISAAYGVSASVSSSSSTTTPGPGQILRGEGSSLLTLKAIPATGSMTTKTVNVTL